MSCNDRECYRHDIGRRFSDPTRVQDSEGALMAGDGAAMGQAPTHGGTGRSRTTDFQGLVTGAGSSYNLRSGQPRHTQPLRGQGRLQGRRCGQQGQAEVVRAGDDVDGQGVDITSGSGTEDSDATLEGDEPVGAIQGRHSPGGGEGAPEQHQSNLVGDLKATEVQLRSLNGSTYTAPELRYSRLAGDLLITEEQRRRRAAAAGDNEYCTGVTPTSSCLSSDVNCSDSVDYSRMQRVMDMVRHHREDDDDVTLPSWRQLVQRVDGRRMSNSPSDGPNHPAETYDNRSSGNVYSQSQPVKHTRFRHDDDNYTDDPVDDVYTTGEYDESRVERTQESGECRESRVQVNSGQKVNTTAFMSVNSSCDNAVMYERQRSSAFIQPTHRHESRTSDGLNTHRVDVHRSDVRDEEVSNSDKRNACSVVEFEDPRILHLAHRHRSNAGSEVEQNDIVESADPQTLHYVSRFIWLLLINCRPNLHFQDRSIHIFFFIFLSFFIYLIYLLLYVRLTD